MMSHRAHKQWLIVTALVIGSFGPIFALGAMPATDALAAWTLDVLSWPVDGNMPFDAPATRFLSALAGGFLIGWGVTIWLLRAHLYDVAPEGVRRAVVGGLLAWFVIDSAGSVASGNPSNAVINVLVLLLAVGPLWRPARG